MGAPPLCYGYSWRTSGSAIYLVYPELLCLDSLPVNLKESGEVVFYFRLQTRPSPTLHKICFHLGLPKRRSTTELLPLSVCLPIKAKPRILSQVKEGPLGFALNVIHRPRSSVPFFVILTKSRVSFIYISISVMGCSGGTAFQLARLQPGRRSRERRRRSVQPVPGLVRVAKTLHTGAFLVPEHRVGCWNGEVGNRKGKKNKEGFRKKSNMHRLTVLTNQTQPLFLNSTQSLK